MDFRLKLLLGILFVGGVTTGVMGTNAVAFDGDNVTEADELRHGTDPFKTDTDDDGVADGVELARGTDLLDSDTDDDGLTDGSESANGTNATNTDTDGDGLLDGEEVHEYDTDPTNADTDDDGLTDHEEVDEHDTEPLESDTDGDGLIDGDEITEGANPHVTDTDGDGLNDAKESFEDTDPARADTDNDGLNDDEELEFGSDPKHFDTDNDELDDVEEHERGTNPTDKDTDGDGLKDGHEVHVDALDDANPLRMDVFIELDWMRGEKPSRSTIRDVAGVFDDAPIKNPDGTTGINLHVTYSNEVERESKTEVSTLLDVLDKNMKYERCGHYYALAMEDTDREDSMAFTLDWHENKPFAFKTDDARPGYYYPRGAIRLVVLHEIGHVLGIHNDDYRGVDSERVDYETYTSVMNYNTPTDSVTFNTGKPFDDWEHMTENMDPPGVDEAACSG